MGCNCKDKAKKAEKYSDSETIETLQGLSKLLFFLRKIITVVLVILVFIIGLPLMFLYLIVSIFKKRNLKINISKLISIFHVK